MTTTESDLRAEAVNSTRHIAEAIYNADVGGLSHRDAPTFMFCSRDTIERYMHLAAAARSTHEQLIDRRLDRALDVEGLAAEVRATNEALRAQLTAFMAMVTEYMGGEPGDDDEVDVCASVKSTLGQLAALVDFDHAGWFDS